MIYLESFDSPKLQTLNCNVVIDVVVIHHQKEVVREERKITQMVSGYGMAGIGATDRVDPPQ